MVQLFIYDYSFFVAVQKTDTAWLQKKTDLDTFMKSAREAVVINILRQSYDFIALQEANEEKVREAILVKNSESSDIQYGHSAFATKKGKSSVIIYRSDKFNIVEDITLDPKFVEKKGEAVCTKFVTNFEQQSVLVCSYHSGGDGLETRYFLDILANYVKVSERVLIGMDGNVNLREEREKFKSKKDDEIAKNQKQREIDDGLDSIRASSKTLGQREAMDNLKKLGLPMFLEYVESVGLQITYGTEADLLIDRLQEERDMTDERIWFTTNKERTSLQTQQKKANQPDKSPKDHILTKGFDSTGMKMFNRFDNGFVHKQDERMPNKNFAADHALILGSFTPKALPSKTIQPHDNK